MPSAGDADELQRYHGTEITDREMPALSCFMMAHYFCADFVCLHETDLSVDTYMSSRYTAITAM